MRLSPMSMSGLSQATAISLRRWNMTVAVIQIASGVAVFFLTDKELKYNWYANFQQIDSNDERGGPFRGPSPKQLFSFNPGYLSSLFFVLSFLNHFSVASFGRKAYEKGLSHRYNAFRWIEYSLSASVMRVLVAILAGLADIHTLFLIFGLTMTTMLFGLVFEVDNIERSKDSTSWLSFWIGFIPHAFAWLTIFCYFFESVSRADPPTFVWAIIFIVFTLDLTFPIIMLLQWKQVGKFSDYVYGEYAFIVLSLTSKQLLCWINFQGANR